MFKSMDEPSFQQRREEIVDAAERCVFARGLHQLKLRDIAHECGKSLGSIYNYFPSKEAIVEALVERQTNRFIATVARTAEVVPGESDEDRMMRQISCLVDAYMEPDAMRLAVFIAAEALVNPRVMETSVAANRRIREFVVNMIRRDPVCRRLDETEEEMEARIIIVRSFLEGLRGALTFHPDVDRSLLRSTTIERLRVLWLWDEAKAGGRTPEMLLGRA
ncbi:TetR/AcrR family transcriptional regulator [Sutterella sp.]|uniref:TetR/AcrR family transcriptional regulator n=1 Tax=Sutterella sp. TaxID=1981025 RepID=UPI0025F60C48|nr:TetR/AcrR family transcriptional regulator [uncultured Sutterella sp.]